MTERVKKKELAMTSRLDAENISDICSDDFEDYESDDSFITDDDEAKSQTRKNKGVYTWAWFMDMLGTRYLS